MSMNKGLDFNVDSDAKVKYGFIGTCWDQGGCIGPSGQRTGPESVRKAMQLAWGYVRDNQIFDIESMRVVDLNNMMIKDFGNIDDYIVDDWQYSINKMTEHVGNLVKSGYTPVVVGGDCSIHYPAFKGIHDNSDGNVGFIYMDAHCDFYNDNPKYGKFSHGHPCGNIMKLPRVNGENVVHFGIRMYEKPEFFDYIKKHGSTPITPQMFYKMGIERTAEKILNVVKKNTQKAVLCIDIDVLDASVAPGSAGNESGGFLSFELQELCKLLDPHMDSIIITEVNANYDLNTNTAVAAAKLFNDYMIYRYVSIQDHL
jgi:agmatinase